MTADQPSAGETLQGRPHADTPAAALPGTDPASLLRALTEAALRRLSAALSFDSRETPAQVTGMRSLEGHTRHLLYSTQGRDIDLRISPTVEGFTLSGQILGPDEAGTVELSRRLHPAGDAHAARHEAALDAFGEFHLAALRQGTYDVRLRLGRDEIVLPTLELGSSGR